MVHVVILVTPRHFVGVKLAKPVNLGLIPVVEMVVPVVVNVTAG